MIDIHCHLLPGIDDGPENLKQSLALAGIAVADGIQKSIVTPHIHTDRYENEQHSITRAVITFRQQLDVHHIPLEIGFAAEVRIGPEIVPMLEEGRIPFLGKLDGDDVLLLELPHSHIPVGSEKFTAWCLARNIRPLIAHPERNRDVMRDINRLAPFVEQGCMLQLTAQSVAGGFGDRAHERAIEMLERGWVSVLGSDAHNEQYRPPVLSAGRDAAAAIVGEAAARAMVEDLPAAITRDNRVTTVQSTG
jgi:protein-tyrosine phosphatase